MLSSIIPNRDRNLPKARLSPAAMSSNKRTSVDFDQPQCQQGSLSSARHCSISAGLPVPSVAEVFAHQFFHRRLDEDLMTDSEDRLRIRDRRSEKRLSAGIISVALNPKMSGGLKPPSAGKPRRNSFTLLFPGPKDSSESSEAQDNRDKLNDYLSQCDEVGMPRHGNDQLSEISADLAPGAWAQPADRTPATGKAVRQQAAIWELCQTELNILRHLKTIIEVYITVLRYLQSSASLLLDVNTDRLFPDVASVLSSHCVLWTRHLRPALQRAATSGAPVRPRDFSDGFVRFQEIFEPALAFCLRITESKDYLRQLEKNEAFNDFVKWAQKVSAKIYNSSGDCSMDLQLKSLLTMPFQRLTKYGLLLQEIQRHTEDSEDRELLDLMISSVSDFCNKMNSLYQDKADEEELCGIADRLEDGKIFEQLDSLGEECSGQLGKFRLNLRAAMPHNGQPRRKLLEGDVRLKDEKGKWTDARLLMFTDLILVTKVYGKRQLLRPLRSPVRLDKLEVCRLDSSSLVLAALTDFKSLDGLHCIALPEPRLCDDWMERIRQAQAVLQSQLTSSGGCPSDVAAVSNSVSHPKPVRWNSDGQSPPPQPRQQQHSPASPSNSGGRVRAATLLEVATAAASVKIHAAHSSSELDAIDREPPTVDGEQPQLRKQVTQSQQCRMSEHRHTVLQQWYLSQHQRERSAPGSVLSKSPLRQNNQQQQQPKELQQRSNSAEEATSAAAAEALIPARELTPERRRLMSYISSSGQAPEV